MPKRRAQAAHSDSDQSPPRRRRVDSEDSSDSDGAPAPQSASQANLQTMISKLVRFALSAEYARIPIRRTDISTKVLGENGSRQFKAVFEGAQSELSSKFGMQMIELPGREKERLGMTQRRAAAQPSQKSQSSTSKSWSLISILPSSYKLSPSLLPPTRAPSLHSESTYTALYTFIISLILLSPSSTIPEAKLERYLKKVNTDAWTPIGQTDKLLLRMLKEGYLVKTRDTSSGEEVIEYSVGPRGKIEVGEQGVKGLVKAVYTSTPNNDISNEELEKKLDRSLGISTVSHGEGDQDDEEDGAGAGNGESQRTTQTQQTQGQTQQTQQRSRTRRTRRRGDDDDDDDDD